MPTPYAENTFQTANIRSFANEVERLTGGALVLDVHPAGSLYAHREIADAVESGAAQIGEVLQSTLSSRSPLFSADSIPFLATSYSEAEALYQAETGPLKAILAADGLVPLFAVPWPPQGLYARTELREPSELSGQNFRVYNSILEQLANALDTVPTRLEVSEIPDAFRRNEIDLMMTSATAGVLVRSWEFLDVFYDLQAWLPKNIVFANADALAALPQEHREAVMQAAEQARVNGWLRSQIDAVESVKALFESGITVVTPGETLADTGSGGAMREISPALLARLEEVSRDIKKNWLARSGSDGAALLNQLLQVPQ